ncbi:MAG: DUF1080 domain-containing protein [Cyclobacteriaceae bacterium]|nr:DUF1080 domain-containing protein [Cyclobacteriaceae bacterium]
MITFKKTILLSTLCLFYMASVAQEMKPEETEVWNPEPKIITGVVDGTPPSDAIILLGKDGLDAWENSTGGKAGWTFENGVVTVKPKTGTIQTKQGFGDIQLHIEWRTPEAILSKKGQARGNSGVFLQGIYEVQVLDSWENRTYSNGQAGSIYKQYMPLVNASRPPQQWQTYDIIYDAPEFAKDGSLVKPAYITVIHNGVLIQNHTQLKGHTPYIGLPEYKAHADKLPLVLQDHGDLISFRNIWVREL